MDSANIEAIQALIEPLLKEAGLELVELTCHPAAGGFNLRLLVDTVGGVSINQCASLNQRIGRLLENSSLGEGKWAIEVSSPGLDRPLVSLRDFERALGEELLLQVEGEDGKIRERSGVLLAAQEDYLVLKTDAGNLTIPRSDIRLAKKAIRLP